MFVLGFESEHVAESWKCNGSMQRKRGVLLQHQHHLLLQALQSLEQARLDPSVVLLMVDPGRSHRQHVLVLQLVQFCQGLDVALFSSASLLICTQQRAYKRCCRRRVPAVGNSYVEVDRRHLC